MRLWFGKVGLGPNILGPLRYLLPYNKLFHYAARYHDIGYNKHRDKNKVDFMFLTLMLSVSKTPEQIYFAFKYFELVDKFGFLFYKKGVNNGRDF